MSGGGGSQSTPQTTTQTTTSSPWAQQQPYLTYGFQQAQDQYQSAKPQYYPNDTVVPFSPETQQAQQAIYNRATSGSPLLLAGDQTLQNTISGSYLDAGNPYFQGAVENAINPVRQEYQNTIVPGITSQFEGGGGNGAGNSQLDFARQNAADSYLRNVGNISSNMAYNNYANERGLQQNATLNAPAYAQADYYDPAQLAALGAAKESQSQALTNADIQKWNFNQNVDQAKLAQYMGLIQGNYGGTSSGTATTPYYQKQGSALQGAAGGALSGAATGAMVGGPYGALGGAVIGGGLGASSSK